jgi:hypothetical protein
VVNALSEAERRTGRQLTLAEADAYWYGLVWQYFRAQPGEAAGLLFRKALLLVNNRGLDSTANMAFWARFSPVPGWLPLPAGLIFALAGVGLWRSSRRGPEALALAAALVSLCGAAIFFHVTPRYRLVLLPLALVFAGAGLAEARVLLAEPWRRKAAPLALVVLLLGLSLIPLDRLVHKPDPRAMEHARLAHYLLLIGRFAEALPEYDAALALDPQGLDDPAALRAERAVALRMAQGVGQTGQTDPAGTP